MSVGGPVMAPNTSGQGSSAVVPEEIKGLSWGGFLLNWIWAIGMQTWIGLIALVPYVGFIMCFVLLFKGNEWAWQNRRWESVEDFKACQRIWTKWGVGLLIFWIAIAILAAIIFPLLIGARQATIAG